MGSCLPLKKCKKKLAIVQRLDNHRSDDDKDENNDSNIDNNNDKDDIDTMVTLFYF